MKSQKLHMFVFFGLVEPRRLFPRAPSALIAHIIYVHFV
jgi:hypothetical protein